MSMTTVYIVLSLAVGIYSAPPKTTNGTKKTYTANFGEPYDFDDYDVVYNMTQSKSFNVRTNGENRRYVVYKPDSKNISYQIPLKVPGADRCREFYEALRIFAGYYSQRRYGKLIVTPHEDDCIDYFDVLEEIEREKIASENSEPSSKRKGKANNGLVKRLLNIMARKT